MNQCKILTVLMLLTSFLSTTFVYADEVVCGSVKNPSRIGVALPGLWQLEQNKSSHFVGGISRLATSLKEYITALAAAGVTINDITFSRDSTSAMVIATTISGLNFGFVTDIEAARKLDIYRYCSGL